MTTVNNETTEIQLIFYFEFKLPLVDKLPLVKVTNEFTEKRLNRRKEFGLFTESDLQTQ